MDLDQPIDPGTANSVPLCPECRQPTSLSLAGPSHTFECRNEACPEFGQPALLDSDNGSRVLDHADDEHPAGPTP